jgi:hypothetical protein
MADENVYTRAKDCDMNAPLHLLGSDWDDCHTARSIAGSSASCNT